jgi:hypothetical protein
VLGAIYSKATGSVSCRVIKSPREKKTVFSYYAISMSSRVVLLKLTLGFTSSARSMVAFAIGYINWPRGKTDFNAAVGTPPQKRAVVVVVVVVAWARGPPGGWWT